jgi:hypothetical protein
MTIYIKVDSTSALRNKVDELVGNLPVAWSTANRLSYPHAEVNYETSFTRGLNKARVRLVKDVYDDSKVEKYEVTLKCTLQKKT